MSDPVTIAKRALNAYAESDRKALESVIADDFHFTSPIDNRLDRKTYFERCWPNNVHMKAINYLHTVADGDRAWIMYEGVTAGKRYRNTEVYTVRDGKIIEALVFFGWDVPHRASEGGFIENDSQGRT